MTCLVCGSASVTEEWRSHLEDASAASGQGAKHEVCRRLGDTVNVEKVERSRVNSSFAAHVHTVQVLCVHIWKEGLISRAFVKCCI